MKKATLFGMIGAIVMLLLYVFWVIVNFGEISLNVTIYKFTNVLGVIGWILIGYFFVELYKKQK
ncbi:MAG: hypothetical protein IKN75_01015 [Prevotella sp.]|nr:hypothetical protein [Prevotella sp.]